MAHGISMTGIHAQIWLNRIGLNLGAIRARLAQGSRLCFVVKANAYGHGAAEVARAAVTAGVELLAVSSVDEGRELREAGLKVGVMLLGPTVPDQAAEVARWRLIAVCGDVATARAIGGANRGGEPLPVHLEIDTGMHRSGCEPAEATTIARSIGRMHDVYLAGLCTHFSAADAKDLSPTRRQLAILLATVEKMRLSHPMLIVHAANSAAISAVPTSHLDLVRVGLAAYGYDPSFNALLQEVLTPVMELSTRVTALRRVRAGDHVSYGREYRVAAETVIATIAAGYGDGYPWPSGRGGTVAEVLVRGERYPLAGRVCMDHCMIDVGKRPTVQIDDRAILFGPGGPTATEVADWADTIPYEVLTRVTKRVPRLYR